MARGIYEVKLKEYYFPALSAADAVEMRNNGNCEEILQRDEVEVRLLVQEEHTMQLFLLAKTMYDMEKFSCKEVEAVIAALAREMGYFSTAEEIADCVTLWIERVAEDMTLHELEEWIIG
jgi:hypothetical protein